MKAVVVGGGVIGMLQARKLVRDGWEVTLVEQGELGREASWAGGGIISPLYPWRYGDAVTALASRSQQLYPELIAELQNESGIDPEYSDHGLLMLKVHDEQTARVWSEQHKSWMEDIETERLYELEPELAAGFSSSLWMPGVASVRNPRLLNALRAIMASSPRISIREHSPVADIEGREVILKTGEVLEADITVVCSGAWSGKLLPQLKQAIEPVKGQMIVFDAPEGLVNRVVLSDGRYVIPRKDGKVLAGSTLEYEGFDKALTDTAKESLYRSAVSLFPELENCPVLHHWAGLRPGSPEGVPVIGEVHGAEGLFINAGHFRNGLVLAPASVELLGDIIAKRSGKLEAGPYKPLQ